MGAARLLLVAGLLAGAGGLSACASGTAVAARPEPFPGLRASNEPDRDAGPAPAAATPVGPMAAAVLETALELRGVPYRFGGEDPGGFDCSGFVRYVFEQHAVALPRTVTEQYLVGRDVGDDAIRAGDLIFFSTVAPGASHVGIAIDPETFVHAPGSGSVVRLERLDTPYWRTRLVGVKRLVALTITG
jgi:cell wall-associated NlpC family hydrolase